MKREIIAFPDELFVFVGWCNKEERYAELRRPHTKVQNMAEVKVLVPVCKKIFSH